MSLLSWQWQLYPEGHRDRRNLVLHLLTAPLFMAGTCALALSWLHWWLALAGLFAMVFAIAMQGRGHKMEQTAPVPFRGPLDVVGRLFLEQWVSFPRYLLSGKLTEAWRQGVRPSAR